MIFERSGPVQAMPKVMIRSKINIDLMFLKIKFNDVNFQSFTESLLTDKKHVSEEKRSVCTSSSFQSTSIIVSCL